MYNCLSRLIHTCTHTPVQVRKDHLLLALEKSESDRIQAELRLAAAAPLEAWRLDQSVRDTTAR